MWYKHSYCNNMTDTILNKPNVIATVTIYKSSFKQHYTTATGMKKFLLSIWTLLLFAPFFAKAQMTLPYGTETIHISGLNSAGELLNQGTTGVTAGNSYYTQPVNPPSGAYGAAHNEAALMYSDFNGMGAYFCHQYNGTSRSPLNTNVTPTPYNGTLIGIQSSKRINETSAGEDKFQMLFEAKKPYRGVGLTPYIAPTYNDDGSLNITPSSYLLLPERTTIRFRTLGGEIQRVTIKIDDNYKDDSGVTYGSTAQAIAGWKGKDVRVTQGTDNTIFIEPETVTNKDFTIELDSRCYAIASVDGAWIPLSNINPPGNIPYIIVNGVKVDIPEVHGLESTYGTESFGTYYVHEDESSDGSKYTQVDIFAKDRIFISAPLYEGVSTFWTRYIKTPTSTQDKINIAYDTPSTDGRLFFYSSNTFFTWGSGTSNKFPHTTLMEYYGNKEGELKFNNYTYGSFTNYVQSALLPVYLPDTPIELTVSQSPSSSDNDLFFNSTYQSFRAWNSAGTSNIVVVRVIRNPLDNAPSLSDKEPDVYIPALTGGLEYNPDTKMLFVTDADIDAGKIKIPVKHEAWARFLRFTVGANAISTNETFDKDETGAKDKLFHPGDEYQEFELTLDRDALRAGNFMLVNFALLDGVDLMSKTAQLQVLYRDPEGSMLSKAPTLIEPSGQKILTLAGDVIGYVGKTVNVRMTPNPNNNAIGDTRNIQYQFVPVGSNNTWAQEPDKNNWTDWKTNPISIGEHVTGRLFVREVIMGKESEIGYRDYRYLENEELPDLSPDNLYKVLPGNLVSVSDSLWVRGAYVSQNSATTGKDKNEILFVTDKHGNALRIVGDFSNSETGFNDFMKLNSITPHIITDAVGVLRGQDKGFPELYLTGTIDYTPLLGTPKSAKRDIPLEEDTTVNKADYNKLMLLTAFKWDGDESFEDSEGNKFKAYHRIGTKEDYQDVVDNLDEGITYRVKGYVGYSAEDGLVILPLAAVPGPRLLAPNPINPEAAPGKYIQMNVISESLEISLNLEGIDEDGDILQYIFGDTDENNWEEWVNSINWDTDRRVKAIDADESFIVGKSELADGGCTVAVRLVSNGLASGIVTVRFNKKDVEKEFTTIEDFKNLFPDDEELPQLSEDMGDKHKYYRYTGLARIRSVTPHYLYIRTTPGDGSNLPDDADLSANSILLYNADGWDQPVAGINHIATAADIEAVEVNLKKLEAGDVITNFALIPTRSKFGNLIGNATGFIRTFRRVEDAKPGANDPIKINAQDNNVKPFDESDRMLRYSIDNVRVIREGNISSNTDEDEIELDNIFTYYLDLPGKPVLNVKDIFEPVNGWDIIYSESALYNITGIVMLADGSKEIAADGTYPDGRYMFAMMPDFSVSGVDTPRAPRIDISGAGVDDKNGTFVNSATVTLTSTTAETDKQADIWYTLDGTDPRLSDTRRKYSVPFTITRNTVIKAYVLANGKPNSEVADTLFTRTGVDSRYIINFLSQAQPGTAYRLTANVRVAAKGGEYFFVRGTQGHYLPIKVENDAIDMELINVDDYLNDMTITADMTNNGTVVRGAYITRQHRALFKYGSPERPSELEEDIEAEPDVVDNLTISNARRYVKLMGVSLAGFKVETDGTDTQVSDQWTLITDKGEGNIIKVNHNVLKPEFDWEAADTTTAAYYNVTGFAMVGDKGEIELWPTAVEKITSTMPVIATFRNNVISNTGTNTSRTVKFYPYTTVTLTPTGISSATIYYYISNNAQEAIPAGAEWNVYAQPFDVAKNCYIHVKAIRPGYEESVHTHLNMVLGNFDENTGTEVSGGLTFSHRLNEKGIPVVKIEPENKTLTPGTYDIYYTTDGSIPSVSGKKYQGEFEMPEGGIIFAILMEAGKAPGKVANYNVWFLPSGIDGIDSDRTDSDAVRAEGGNIIAPEGSEVYDLGGRKVGANGLRRGIYIVRLPGSTRGIKIKVQ